MAGIPGMNPAIRQTFLVDAGKFRRYHGEGLGQFLDLVTMRQNIRDIWRVVKGIWQSYIILGKLKPDVIFTPGGYVGVPVGVASALRGISLVTHDLDSVPGLANRINSRWARVHAVGMPKEYYSYDPAATAYVGVPVSNEFSKVSDEQMWQFRHMIDLANHEKLLFIVGGGQGAQRINEAFALIAQKLLAAYPGLCVVHCAGSANMEQVVAGYKVFLPPNDVERIKVFGFMSDLYKYSGAADLIITRAGASNMAEFSVQNKPCIVIPSAVLSGGHQLKNVEHLEAAGAVTVVREYKIAEDPEVLYGAIKELLDDDTRRHSMGEKFGSFAMPNAAADIADIISAIGKTP